MASDWERDYAEGEIGDGVGKPVVGPRSDRPRKIRRVAEDETPYSVHEDSERRDALFSELHAWWMKQAQVEIDKVVPKAVEYGAADLDVMAEAMVMLLPKRGITTDDPTQQDLERAAAHRLGIEMALAFYALGKVARLFGAFEHNESPSDDTWHDLGVYCRMAQRVRETGEWV